MKDIANEMKDDTMNFVDGIPDDPASKLVFIYWFTVFKRLNYWQTKSTAAEYRNFTAWVLKALIKNPTWTTFDVDYLMGWFGSVWTNIENMNYADAALAIFDLYLDVLEVKYWKG